MRRSWLKRKYDYDLIVLGSGSGGGIAAQIGVRLSKKVAVIEPAEMGGECPNFGCVPTKALLQAAEVYDAAVKGKPFGINGEQLKYNYPAIKAWKDLAVHRTGTWEGKRIFEAAGIHVITGKASFTGKHQIVVNNRHYSARNFLVATGTHNFIPPIEGLEDTGFITFKEAIDLTKPPKSLFIIGAGPIGCEFAELFSIFGTKVILCDITPRLMVREDAEVGELAQKHFEVNRGVTVMMKTQVTRISKDGDLKCVHFEQDGQTKTVNVEEIMLATGKRANVDIGLENAKVAYTPRGITANQYMQTSAKHIFAAGDVVGPYQFTHTAEYQSRIAANNMWHRKKIAADYRAVPRCVFIEPEIASVGMSEEDCSTKKLNVRSAIAPISLIGRANTSNVEEGFVKVVAKPDGTLVGATIVSPRAGEMIHELTLAIQMGLTATQVANTIHAFPTWSEAVRTACAQLK